MRRPGSKMGGHAKLADFRTRSMFTGKYADDWKLIRSWQAEGLITVEPVTRDSAWVTLTDKGRKAVKS